MKNATNTAVGDSSVPILELSIDEDDPDIRRKYRPFILQEGSSEDWTDQLELATAMDMTEKDLYITGSGLKVLVLFGSLRRM
jgi:arsenic resistance protein ArsH